VTVSGVKYTLAVPALVDCSGALVTVTPADPAVVAAASDAADVGVSLVVVMWTDSAKPGAACASDGSTATTCRRMIRRVSLHLDASRTHLFAIITPDPSVRHFQFLLQVWLCVCQTSSPSLIVYRLLLPRSLLSLSWYASS
jgi:hypothetical protein